MKKKGFSLLESMVVISLILLISTLVYTGWGSFNRWMVRAEAEKLYAVCRYLQQRALASGQEQTLVFDVLHNCYQYNDVIIPLTRPVIFGTIKGIKGPPSSPTSIVNYAITFPSDTITFYPDGIIKSGTVYFADSSLHCSYAVSVPISTISYMRIYRYDGSWKQLQ
jgi:prepilin-type N-terminal cleavage/methylation domain-containing protein